MSNPNPLIGRRVQLVKEDRLVATGIVVDSFYAADFYRLVVEVEQWHQPQPLDRDRKIVVFPIGMRAYEAGMVDAIAVERSEPTLAEIKAKLDDATRIADSITAERARDPK